MKWAKERDLLIAQTKAFVQSVAATKREIETRAEVSTEFAPVEFASVEFARVDKIEEVERPIEIVPLTRPLFRSGVREEIQGRVAAFRAHQQLFHRERDAYFNSVLARLRTSMPSLPKAPGG